jgi:hypothetical protein
MSAEGWDGKSIREHVELAGATASTALELAEGAQDELMNLSIAIRMLAKCCGPDQEIMVANILDDCHADGARE